MSQFDVLNDDVIMYILEYLNDMDKIRFLSVDLRLHNFINYIWFNEIYDYILIKGLPYLDRFKYIKYETNTINIPKRITHLTFGREFDQNIKGCIPNSVTHLIFGEYFNQDIKDCIPNSVTHLTFGFYFDRNIKDCIRVRIHAERIALRCIPDSVIHLTLNRQFYRRKKKYIDKNIQISLK
ncbi:putative F-box and FNIP repeat-containing protein [Megavirus courdo11]|uniref:Putative F-box and FNIP repeat-containing protein n=1 Tax=Megavirus courdo11 TaxID=1128140 RepID=K7Z7J2_9VIRU|nr:putative F-box and FNIP repeat-containing protein [Megavirus courdo11]